MSSLTRPGLSRILHGVFLASMAIGFFAAAAVPTPLSAQVPDPTPTTAPPTPPPTTTAPPTTAAPTTDPPETTVAPATTAAPVVTTATTVKKPTTSSTASTILQTTTTPDQLPTLPPLPNANQPAATPTTAAFDSGDDDPARVSPLFPALSIGGFIVALLILVIQFLLSSRRS